MNTGQSELRERYSRMVTEELIELHQRGTLTEVARPLLENELSLRGISPTMITNTRIQTPQEIDREVFTERGKAALITMLWRLFWRLVVPVVIIFTVSYALRFWDWLTK